MATKTVCIQMTAKMSQEAAFLAEVKGQLPSVQAELQKAIQAGEADLDEMLESGYQLLCSNVIDSSEGSILVYTLHKPDDAVQLDTALDAGRRVPPGALVDTWKSDGRPLPPSPAAVPSPATAEAQTLESFKAMIGCGSFVVLDTETTGLDVGEICQIAIIDYYGSVLLDTHVRPMNGIPDDATRIHGITNEMVEAAPTWSAIRPEVERILTGRDVVVWNAVYDRKMMHKSAEAAHLPKTDWKTISQWWCAMEAFAEVYGEWNDYRQSYRWQKLVTAVRYYDLPENGTHSALGDALMTLAVCKKMLKEEL